MMSSTSLFTRSDGFFSSNIALHITAMAPVWDPERTQLIKYPRLAFKGLPTIYYGSNFPVVTLLEHIVKIFIEVKFKFSWATGTGTGHAFEKNPIGR